MIQWRLSEKQQISDQYLVFWIRGRKGRERDEGAKVVRETVSDNPERIKDKKGPEIEMGSTETTKAEKDILMDRCKYDPKAMRERTAN